MGLINELARRTALQSTNAPDRADAPSVPAKRGPKPKADSAQISPAARELAERAAADPLDAAVSLLNRLTDAPDTYAPARPAPKSGR